MRMGRGLIQKEYRDALGDADTLGIYTGHSVLQTLGLSHFILMIVL